MINQTKGEMPLPVEMGLASSIIVFPKSKIKVLIQEIHSLQGYKFKTMCQLNKFSKLIKEMARYILVLMALPKKPF
jgi:hypothetical protein